MSTDTSSMRGILPAVVTPFDDEGRFCQGSFEKLLARVYSAGVDGIYVCGQTGEGLQQSVAQRKLVAEAAVRATPPGKTVIVHVGAGTTAEAVELAWHAARAGAAAVSSLPPLGGFSFAEIRDYYRALAAASGAPLLVYLFPDVCPSVSTADQVFDLLSIPNVIGLKFTDYDLYKMWCIKQSGALLYNGRDEVLVSGLLTGADGGIGSFYNIAPHWFAEVYRLGREGRWMEARAVQQKINVLIRIGLSVPPLGAVKTMLGWMGIPCGPCLAPRHSLTPEHEARLRRMLAESGLADLDVAQKATP